jgi:hypothetical protein
MVDDGHDIVSELQFADSANGGSNGPIGTFVGEGMGAASNQHPGQSRLLGSAGSGSSRDATIQAGMYPQVLAIQKEAS